MSEATITLSGYATDDLEVIKRVKVSHGSNRLLLPICPARTWSLEMDTSLFHRRGSGINHNVLWIASDKSVSINVLLIVDNSPPSVMVTTPTEYNDYGIDPEDENDGCRMMMKSSVSIKT